MCNVKTNNCDISLYTANFQLRHLSVSFLFFQFVPLFFLYSQLACVVLTANSCLTLPGHVSVTLNSVTLSYLKCIRWSLAHNETRAVVFEPWFI